MNTLRQTRAACPKVAVLPTPLVSTKCARFSVPRTRRAAVTQLRRLAVSFPPSNANQIFYYDERYMQRRMDYAPDVTDNAPIAHYTHDPKTVDGFVFPTRRLVHLRDAEGKANQDFAVITLNIYAVSVE